MSFGARSGPAGAGLALDSPCGNANRVGLFKRRGDKGATMAAPGENLRINGERLWDSLMQMARVGPGVAGGNNRQALTDADAEGRALFQTWCEAAGCEMALDSMGNMFAMRPGTDADALPVYVGSHLDTQPTGGKYDGVLGVLAGLEIVRTLDEMDIRTRHPIVVANWTNEEGTRFAPAMLSSGVFAGVHDEAWAKNQCDADGKRFGDELRRIGWEGDEPVGARRMHAFFELHIEQGPILEAEGADIGVVTHGQGLVWTQVTVTGRDSHTGSTPMPMRRNAGLGMARIMDAVDRIARAHAPHAVGAVGHAEIHPNSRNVIPGRAVFTVDFRSPDKAVIAEMAQQLRDEARRIAKVMDLEVAFEQVGGFDPVTFDDGCVDAIRRASERLGYSHRDMVSGAGHDACWIARVAPTAMVMCPCVGGLSHNEAEEITPQWATAGADVLLHAVLETARVES
jgi:N-carbamoyl-L-amino-acid hydrolase